MSAKQTIRDAIVNDNTTGLSEAIESWLVGTRMTEEIDSDQEPEGLEQWVRDD